MTREGSFRIVPGGKTGPRRGAAVLALVTASLVIGACSQRIIRITSEPSDAMVTLNDVQIGRTPVEVDFTYFGVYDVRLAKPGYEPLATTANAEAPFHEWPVVDIAAAAVPVRKETLVQWHFVLTPADESRETLIGRAAELRGAMDKAEPTTAP